MILMALALVVAGLAVVLLWGYAPEYQVLYSKLSGSDSGAVIDKLRDQSIPYKVHGNTISVPAELVYEVRMDLAGQGLPQGGGVGLEIFDNTSFGVTQFVQKVNYKRAMQGELSRTISQLDAIDSARVHLVIPDKGIFLGDDDNARASIVLSLKPGKVLSRGSVNAIVHLVTNSSEHLKVENVTVLDTKGRMYTKGIKEDDGLQLAATQIESRMGMERELESRVQTMIERVLGSGKVVARISMDIDIKHIDRTEESFDPESQVVRSEQISKEKSSGAAGAGGIPGVSSNLPGGTGASAGSSAAKKQSQSETINYEINKVVSRVIEPITTIKRLSVSVLIDGSYDVALADDGTETRTYVPRTEEEIALFTDMVKGAVGYSEDRGDIVSVVNTPFKTDFVLPPEEIEEGSLLPPQLLPSIIKYATIAVISILAILLLLRPMIKGLLAGGGAMPVGAFPVRAPQAQASLPMGGAPAVAEPEEDIIDFQMPKQDNSVAGIKKVIRENPQQTAMVIKNWVKE
jgi:flagellar M-ring protein FliF